MAARSAATAALLVLGYVAGAALLWCAEGVVRGSVGSAEGHGLRGAGAPLRQLQVVPPAPTAPAGQVLRSGNGFIDVTVDSQVPRLDERTWSSTGLSAILSHLLFGMLYYVLVVSKYPRLYAASQASARLQQENELMATCRASCANCVLSYCCYPARAAHTFDATGTCGYWPSLFMMSFCPFCTLYYMNSCTELNRTLGGQPKNWCLGLLCTWCCSCCVIAQDAESLDAATGASTGCCGVEQPPMAIPMGAPGMAPGMTMPPGFQPGMPAGTTMQTGFQPGMMQSQIMQPQMGQPQMGQTQMMQPMPMRQQSQDGTPDCMQLLCGSGKEPVSFPGQPYQAMPQGF